MAASSSEHSDRDDSWAEGLKQDDREVFEDLFRTLYADLVAYAQTIVRREDRAEGVVQDVFLQIWKRDVGEPSDDVTAYAYRAVHNRALNAVRDQRSHAENPGARTTEALRGYVPVDREVHTAQLEEAIEDTIQELPDRRRQIFLLSRRHDLTYAQIADVLDISERTVETQIRRALQALRECVSKYE
jgi:RNA polymerase sigma-70 factor (ECF subfamily)